MNISEQQLKEIEECGKCQFDVKSIAVIIEVDPDELTKEIADTKSSAFKSYNKGRLMGEYEVRKSILELATRMSSQAQEMYLKLKNELKVLEA